MANTLEDQLHYAFGDQLPATGTTMEVAPGVRWLRMPLPFALNHINLWLLRDTDAQGDGWAIVDCGIASAVRTNLREGRGPLSGHGGSTITQQTAKLLCLGTQYDPASGMTEAEYRAMMIAGGRSPEGNRFVGEDGDAQAHRQPQGAAGRKG